jgi:hypothetical protein
LGLVVVCLLVVGGVAAGRSTSGCERSHSCPSPNHGYTWYDQSWNGWNCAREDNGAYDPGRDIHEVMFHRQRYGCRPANQDGDGYPDATDGCPYMPGGPDGCRRVYLGGSPMWFQCGYYEDRPSVAIAADRRWRHIRLVPHATTIAALRALRGPRMRQTKPMPPHAPRLLGFETQTERVTVDLQQWSRNGSKSIEIAVTDPHRVDAPMVVRLPAPSCIHRTPKPLRRRMLAAWQSVTEACGRPPAFVSSLRGRATIVGVRMGFAPDRWDHLWGAAPNGVELQPVLSFHVKGCRSGRHWP